MAEKISALLDESFATLHAPAALKHHEGMLARLKAETQSLEVEVTSAHAIISKSLTNQPSYGTKIVSRWMRRMTVNKEEGSNVVKRWWDWATSSTQDGASQTDDNPNAEREFLTAYENHQSAQAALDEFTRLLSTEEGGGQRISAAVDRHVTAQKELDAYYQSSSFASPEKAAEVTKAKVDLDEANAFVERKFIELRDDLTALAFVKKAMNCLSVATQHMDQSFKPSPWETETPIEFAKLMTSDPVSTSQKEVNIAMRYYGFARRYQPKLPESQKLFVGGGQFFANVIYDDDLAKLSPAEVVEHVAATIRFYTRKVFMQYSEQDMDVDDNRSKLRKAEDSFKTARQVLQELGQQAS